MVCEECRRLIHDWLEAALDDERDTPPLPEEVSLHVQSCRECRARVEAGMVLTGQRAAPVPPSDLAERVKTRIRHRAESRDRARFAVSQNATARDATTRAPRGRSHGLLRLAASAAVLVVAVLAGMLIGRSLPGSAPGSEVPVASESGPRTVVRVEFRLEAPRASQVAVVGDWNGWDAEANPLRDSDGDGVWETTVTLRPGEEYQYQFLVDDETWMPDPSSPLTVDDGFGGMNSVLNI